MKWFNLFLCLLFLLFAYFQWNDPDPYGWIAMYLSVAVICGMAAFNKFYLPFIMLVLIVSMLWGLSLLPDFINWIRMGGESIVQEMKAEKPHVELTREFLGLIIIVATIYYQYKRAKKLGFTLKMK